MCYVEVMNEVMRDMTAAYMDGLMRWSAIVLHGDTEFLDRFEHCYRSFQCHADYITREDL